MEEYKQSFEYGETVYLLNIASNNFNTFAAYEILSKKIFINK